MRIAIVGSGGFIGRRLCAAVEANGHEAIGISSASAAFAQDTGLIADRALEGRPLNAMVYLSQSPHYRDVPRQAPHLWAVNVVSAVKAAEWAHRCGARRIVHASTGNVYAPSFAAHSESDPVRKDDWYALSKLHAEEALRLLQQVDVTSARLFGVYGPGQRSKLIPTLMAKVLSGEPIRLQLHPHDDGDSGGLRLSLAHIDDVVRIMMHLVAKGGPPVVNVAGPGVLSLREIAETIGRHLGRQPVFEVDQVPRQFDLIADNSLVSTLVGGTLTPFASGIPQTVEEFRSSPRPA